MHQTVVDKIVVVRTSPRFTAMLGFLLGQDWIEPSITEMVITSDGFLMVGYDDDIGVNEFVGDAADLTENLLGIAQVAKLTDKETEYLVGLIRSRVTDWRIRPMFEVVQ